MFSKITLAQFPQVAIFGKVNVKEPIRVVVIILFFFNSPPNKEVSKFKVKLRASRKIQANRVYEFRSKTRFGDKKLKKE